MIKLGFSRKLFNRFRQCDRDEHQILFNKTYINIDPIQRTHHKHIQRVGSYIKKSLPKISVSEI